MGEIRPCGPGDVAAILAIINAAAERYRGEITDDLWHEPYMSAAALDQELAAGVRFWGVDGEAGLAGVMGIQDVGDVNLIRHAYVAPAAQGLGIGGRLLSHLTRQATKPLLVGTWAAATWAIGFYERHGWRLQPPARKDALLARYWTISPRQAETSVVLALEA